MKQLFNTGLLWKIKASSIVETLVASVVIVLIFSMATMVLSNVFKSNILSDTSAVENRVNKLIYLEKNKKITVPYSDEFKGWELNFNRSDGMIVVNGKRRHGDRVKSFKRIYYDHNF